MAIGFYGNGKKKNAENIDKKEDLFEAERLTLQMIEKITRVL